MASTDIPADKARYGRFTEIYERNESTLHSILDEAAAGTLQSPVASTLGNYYGACMDEARIESEGMRPVQALMKVATSVRSPKTFDSAVAKLHSMAIPVLFRFTPTPDFVDATMMIGEMNQGGLGLPDKDYYLNDDERSKGVREGYREHVAAILSLGGMKAQQAKKAADDVMRIETEIAKVAMDRADRRNPENVYHKIDRAGVTKLVPQLDWENYFETLGVPAVQEITVDNPAFFAQMNKMREDIDAKSWRNYFSWQVLHHTASLLPNEFVAENFKLSQLISGATELPPRWKRCVSSTDSALGELLAQPYLERMFSPAAKQGVDAMVRGISAAFGEVVRNLDWMSDDTKERALGKLGTMNPMFGYPEKWKTYEWEVGEVYGDNVLASRRFELARDLQKIGKPYDRSEWFMSPPTTNAYYNPQARD